MLKDINLTGTNFMKDKYFLDTNILIYGHSDIDPQKQEVARSIMDKENVYISTQVLNEIIRAFYRKF